MAAIGPSPPFKCLPAQRLIHPRRDFSPAQDRICASDDNLGHRRIKRQSGVH